jgi:hypothetical protein
MNSRRAIAIIGGSGATTWLVFYRGQQPSTGGSADPRGNRSSASGKRPSIECLPGSSEMTAQKPTAGTASDREFEKLE